MYRIFINDKALILGTSEGSFNHSESAEIEGYSCSSCMTRAINKLENGLCERLVLQGEDLNLMWQDFSSRYELIEAAGGVVLNSQGDVLWIMRNDKWDLPKGKVEEGELVEETAVREVEEECALHGVARGEFLGVTYHTYKMKGVKVLKKTYWYAMICADEQNLKPQIEEGITEVIWADKEKHAECALDTYTSIAELLKREKVLHHLGF